MLSLVLKVGQASRPATLCLLCNNKELPFGNAANHVTSATHRLNYLEAFFPIVSHKFSKVLEKVERIYG